MSDWQPCRLSPTQHARYRTKRKRLRPRSTSSRGVCRGWRCGARRHSDFREYHHWSSCPPSPCWNKKSWKFIYSGTKLVPLFSRACQPGRRSLTAFIFSGSLAIPITHRTTKRLPITPPIYAKSIRSRLIAAKVESSEMNIGQLDIASSRQHSPKRHSERDSWLLVFWFVVW